MCAVLSRSVMSNSLLPHGLQPIRLCCPWGFSGQVYWSGLPRPPPGDLPNPGIEPWSPALQVDSLPTESPGMPKLHEYHYQIKVMVNFLRLYVCGYNTLNKNGMKYTKVYQYCHCPVMVRLYAIKTSNFSNQMNFH